MTNRNKGKFTPQVQMNTPVSFRCKVGGEWLPLSKFSANQQKLIYRQAQSRRPIEAAHSGMTCIDHSAGIRTELQCDLCLLKKPIDQFSKNARKADDPLCMRCTAWTETQEPNVTPAPLETGHVSVEENAGEVWNKTYSTSSDFFENDDAPPRAPISSFESLGFNEREVKEARTFSSRIHPYEISEASFQFDDSASIVSGHSTSSQNMPPHLMGRLLRSTPSVTSSVSGASVKAASSTLPPHLRATSKSNESASRSLSPNKVHIDSSESVSTATTVRLDRAEAAKARQIQFNAWDLTGVRHSRVKDPTVISSDGSSVISAKGSDDSTDDAKSMGDRDYMTPMPEVKGWNNVSKWPNTSELRFSQSEMEKQPDLANTKARSIDPKIDHQRRLLYGESDDKA